MFAEHTEDFLINSNTVQTPPSSDNNERQLQDEVDQPWQGEQMVSVRN